MCIIYMNWYNNKNFLCYYIQKKFGLKLNYGGYLISNINNHNCKYDKYFQLLELYKIDFYSF